jgi:hypothetical protein
MQSDSAGKLRHDGFDHRITNKELPNDLNASGIDRPIPGALALTDL